MIAEAFEVDFEDYSKKFINQNLIYSTLSIFGLGLLLLAIKYRWRFVSKQRKEIISILDIVSLESIKSNPSLARLFDDMELNFYKWNQNRVPFSIFLFSFIFYSYWRFDSF